MTFRKMKPNRMTLRKMMPCRKAFSKMVFDKMTFTQTYMHQDETWQHATQKNDV